jgi:O-acetyl-ADP-ribose deacetylase (regulator of RNase III)
MTIRFVQGNIFNSNCDTMVVPVNCQGVAGKGLALKFAQHYPKWEQHYRRVCKSQRMKPGIGNWYRAGFRVSDKPQMIFSFPTKIEWKADSDLNLIGIGLGSLLWGLHTYTQKSVAIPALGCGLGGLPWEPVKKLLETADSYLPHVYFRCYLPGDTKKDAAYTEAVRAQ